MAMYPRWRLSDDTRTGEITCFTGEPGHGDGSILAIGSIYYFAVQARYEEGITDLDEPIDRAMEIQNVHALLTQVEQVIASQGKALE